MSRVENFGAEARRARVIAIDGPAAAGKGTLARRLATHLEYAYLDTGLIYRAVGLRLLDDGKDPDDAVAAAAVARRLSPPDMESEGLRSDRAARAASKVAAIPAVREALLSFQRQFAEAPPLAAPGAVLDGRDIGTVVCPRADLKLFVTASVEVRAARRLRELRERGMTAIEGDVLHDMQERDARDSTRDVSPLERASDAVVIDTSGLTPDAVFAAALEAVKSSIR